MSYTPYLYISTFGGDVRVESGTACRYHFGWYFIAVEVGMVNKETIHPCRYFGEIFLIGYAFVAAGGAGSVVTVTGAGGTSPEVNVLGKGLTDVCRTHYLSIQGDYFGISFVGACELCEYPQNQYIEYGEEYTECECKLK